MVAESSATVGMGRNMLNLFMKKLIRDRVVPTIWARVS